ncbi:D-amino-acid transaminase [Pacificoceanicola onchidii]|uniref:D-amino-acid transaminase n=1 Tax=Pacificoceanicola onchidii TaxID=2562685 RepID=UPI003B833ADC
MRTVYVNGAYLPESDAKISVFDRGFLFADAVYEVTSVVGGALVDFDAHMARLARSMAELDMAPAPDKAVLLDIHQEMITRNAITEGLIYMQVSRGQADRDFDFSGLEAPLSLVMFTQDKPLVDNALAARGQSIALVEDGRWARSDIKTVQLLFSSLAKTRAKKQGFDDVWMTRDGMITEGSSANAYIVTEAGEIITHTANHEILRGVTRQAVLRLAESLQLKVIERPFSVAELTSAREAFSTSSSGFVNPVVAVDGAPLGDGTPGQVATRLRETYVSMARSA